MATRSIRRARRRPPGAPAIPHPKPVALQIFVFKNDQYLGAQVFDFTTGPIMVGRHDRAHLALEGDNVSRRQCRIVFDANGVVIEDLGSANGTYVNRKRIKGRHPIGATDSIHIGSYVIKVRAILGVGNDVVTEHKAQPETRVETILSAEDSENEIEISVQFQPSVDNKLYEQAVRRQTGGEAAKAMLQSSPRSTLVPTGEEPPKVTQKSAASRPATLVPNTVRDRTRSHLSAVSSVISSAFEVELSEEDALDPSVEARLRDLDELIASLDDGSVRRRSSTIPWKNSASRRLESAIDEASAEDAPTNTDEDEDMKETCEFARELASSLALDGALVPHIEKDPSRPPAPVIPLRPMLDERAAFAQTEMTEESQEAIEVPISSVISSAPKVEPTPPPQLERVDNFEASHERVMLDSALYDDVWASRVDDSIDIARARPPEVHPPIPSAPVMAPSTRRPPPLPQAPSSRRPPPPLPQAAKRMPPPPPPADVHVEEDATVAATPEHYDGVEIACRIGGRLADIGVLRKEGEQYILGHNTPQGSVAPARAHVGLRLLRLNLDRTVDLVFPRDAAGHLVRGNTTAMFGELSEGRKYSCLRLEVDDIVTVILGQGRHMISYHIRFLRRPRSLFRSLRRA